MKAAASLHAAAVAAFAASAGCGAHAASILNEEIARIDVEDELPGFDSFVEAWGRSYEAGGRDYEHRHQLYEERLSWARQHNRRADRRWTAGVNQHWDWREEELDALHGGPARQASPVVSALVEEQAVESRRDSQARLRRRDAAKARLQDLPVAVSWAQLNSTRRVQDQGKCGSCWAVTAATLLDLHHEIYRASSGDSLRTFSSQDMVNCVPNPHKCGGTGGCHGATVELALDYAWKNGAKADAEVPYRAHASDCNSQSSSVIEMSLGSSPQMGATARAGESFGLWGWEKLPENEYEPLLRAVYEKGPVGVSVHAREWHFYKSGVFDECQRDVVLGHAVTLLGIAGVTTGVRMAESASFARTRIRSTAVSTGSPTKELAATAAHQR
eukprot:TRINITY_DN17813_c0_g1_i2.p1 TRINITY_DN17813_c0_g1~~TRINITY_DN17813_c0_g1_i2.p1  ORF type:complete len:386 (+),score=72.25 TRINITY_DN17813_c0_g1_i2:102-1259(+)